MELEKTTEKILKIIRDTLVILMFVILFIGLGYEGTFIKEGSSPLLDFINKYINYSGLGPLIIAVIGLIISYIIGDVDPIAANNFKHSKKYKFKYNDAGELNEDIKNKLKGYNYYREYSISNKEKMHLYYKCEKEKLLKIWLIADLVTFNNHKRKIIQDYLEEFFIDMYGNEKTNDRMEYFLLVCVKKYTPLFETTIRSNYDNWSRDLGLPVGIVFENKRMYIPSVNELELIDKEKYEYMSEEFFKVVEAAPLRKTKD